MNSSSAVSAIPKSAIKAPADADGESDAQILQSMLEWSADLAKGEVRLEIRADDAPALATLKRVVVESFLSEGYNEAEGHKASVALEELVRNVAVHSGDSDKRCAIVVRYVKTPYRHTATIAVADRGPGFDFSLTLARLQEEIQSTRREHGLLRALRYGTTLSQQRPRPHTMEWTRRQRREAPLYSLGFALRDRSDVILAGWFYSSGMIRIADEVYFLDEMEQISTMCARFLDLIFEPIRRSAADVVLYEVKGAHGSETVWWNPEQFLLMVVRYLIRNAIKKNIMVLADTEYETHSNLSHVVEIIAADKSWTGSIHFFESRIVCLDSLRR